MKVQVLGREQDRFLLITFEGTPYKAQDFVKTLVYMYEHGELPRGEVLKIEISGSPSFYDGLGLSQALGQVEYMAFAVADDGRWVIRYTRDQGRYQMGALLENCSPR